MTQIELLNAALSAQQANDTAGAMQKYEQLISTPDGKELALATARGLLTETSNFRESINTLKANSKEPAAIMLLNIGCLMARGGHYNDALGYFEQSMRLDPLFPATHWNAASCHMELNAATTAIECAQRAVELAPDSSAARNVLANAFCKAKRYQEADEQYNQSIVLDPKSPDAYNNLGNLYQEHGKYREAIVCYANAVKANENYLDGYVNMANAYMAILEIDNAFKCCAEALRRNPEFPNGHWARALGLLLSGKMEEGWKEYEWRWKFPALKLSLSISKPQWNGQHLNGERVAVVCEQGFGDSIMMMRYLPLMRERGCSVIVLTAVELQKMFLMQGYNAYVQNAPGTPNFEYYVPMLSLPRVFGTTLENIPPITLVAEKAPSLPSAEPKIGVAWKGRPTHVNDKNRSIPAGLFGRIGDVAGVKFYCLQKDAGTTECPWAQRLALSDFMDTAAVINSLDLLITADTAVGHLAGALGKPVWVLVPYFPDWRWRLNSETTEWYPSMRLFRQPKYGDWQSVIDRVVREIFEWKAARSASLLGAGNLQISGGNGNGEAIKIHQPVPHTDPTQSTFDANMPCHSQISDRVLA